MHRRALKLLVCPACGDSLRLAEIANEESGEIIEGQLDCARCSKNIPIVRNIPRFVPSQNYAANFGFQWNRYDRIQLDKVMGNNLSRDRWNATTGWPARMEGQRILEAGCGAGRFTELALETGGELYSFDLSDAVDANLRNHAAQNLNIFQASIYEIPLRPASFDKVFCMGVLQHCPDVKKAFLSLIPFLKPGGEIVIDVYQMHTGIAPLKYWARPFVKHMKTETIYKLLHRAIPAVFEVKKAIHRIPGVGPTLAKVIPIGPISHAPRLNYTDDELKEVKILSALDMLSPKYDQPQKIESVRAWFDEAGLVDVKTWLGYNGINARARRSN